MASSVDTDKVRAAGVPAVQINTGGNCHLDAPQVRGALEQLPLAETDLLFIENVGNLICPVAFDLGEHTRLAIASVPEGDDKPHKYPGIYSAVDVLVLTKIDLLPYVPFNRAEFRRLVTSLNPCIRIFELSCVSGRRDGRMDCLAAGTDSTAQMSDVVKSSGRSSGPTEARHIAVYGVVQGVGFRPFVYRLAQEQGLAGWVRNTSWGVEIEVDGRAEALERFVPWTAG